MAERVVSAYRNDGEPRSGVGDVICISTGLADWEVFDVNEIELLPLVSDGKLDLAGLIAAKRADAFGRPRSLMNYLYFTNGELFRVKGDPSETRSKPWFPRLMDRFKKWGFRHADPSPS
jgi:hypothetical protein